MSGRKILLVDNDLFFSTRIADQLRKLGFETEVEGVPAAVLGKARGGVIAVILNLSMRTADPIEIIRSLKSDPETASIPIIAFGSHKNSALLESAKSAGCRAVLPNSTISASLFKLLSSFNN